MEKSTEIIRIGTRGSKLALVQSESVKKDLEGRFPGVSFEIVVIKTKGDRILDSPLSKIGDKGLFTREIEEQLLDGRIDCAVHSMKDLPTKLPAGLRIGAVTKRLDPRDVLVSRNGKKLKDLRPGDIVATGSLRRKAQILAFNPELSIIDMRGNLNTRIQKFSRDTAIAAMVLAYAGISRMDLSSHVSEIIPEDIIIPAVGQAALSIEIRDEGGHVSDMMKFVHDDRTAKEITCERAFLSALGGGCQVPIAGNARISGERVVLTGMVASTDGTRVFRDSMEDSTENNTILGQSLAERLLRMGARGVLDEIYRHAGNCEVPQ